MAMSVFFVATTVICIFSDLMFSAALTTIVPSAFILAVCCVIASLVLFIREFAMSLGTIKKDIDTRAQPDVLRRLHESCQVYNGDGKGGVPDFSIKHSRIGTLVQ
jgi:hypothetical protein